MIEYHAVIGAMYGDEGKGFTVSELTKAKIKDDKPVLVIKHNGTAQAGHTVYKNKSQHKYHIFKTFGSGTFEGAHTYLYKTFYVCPMSLMIEYNLLKQNYKIKDLKTLLHIHPDCPVILPWDKLMNETREVNHGTCGFGLFEATQRPVITIRQLFNYHTNDSLLEALIGFRNQHFTGKCDLYGDTLLVNFYRDLEYIFNLFDFRIPFDLEINNKRIIETDLTIIFENGQGLGLDQNNKEGFPHLTPSNTGSRNIIEFIEKEIPINLCSSLVLHYVTRPYTTRHGYGPLKDECNFDLIPLREYIETNVTNDAQGALRFAPLDLDTLIENIDRDLSLYMDSWILNYMNYSIEVTHTHLIKTNIPEAWCITKNGILNRHEFNNYLFKNIK